MLLQACLSSKCNSVPRYINIATIKFALFVVIASGRRIFRLLHVILPICDPWCLLHSFGLMFFEGFESSYGSKFNYLQIH